MIKDKQCFILTAYGVLCLWLIEEVVWMYTNLIFFDTAGQAAFREFLKSEFSEENILFWLACEEYKKVKSTSKMNAMANKIYSEFVKVQAPREINIDCGTRDSITKNISSPNINSFDNAQKIIYSLMAKDCYPRFLRSDLYKALLKKSQSRNKER
uniref:Regulator of G-protein signaling 1 n=1 Tax=Erpetoichthys calabaricus TaxID=27687 RepID=A0A8C4XAW2_ERPCA